MHLSIIFEDKPEQWGLRGDPYLWDAMFFCRNMHMAVCPAEK